MVHDKENLLTWIIHINRKIFSSFWIIFSLKIDCTEFLYIFRDKSYGSISLIRLSGSILFIIILMIAGILIVCFTSPKPRGRCLSLEFINQDIDWYSIRITFTQQFVGIFYKIFFIENPWLIRFTDWRLLEFCNCSTLYCFKKRILLFFYLYLN